eukprot:Gb_31866 [translate_table: standard]
MYSQERLLGRNRNKRWRQSRSSTITILILGLGIGIIAWFALVFSSRHHSCWYRLQEWQGSPLGFPWQPSDITLVQTQGQQEEDDYEQNDQHLGLRSFQRGSLSTNLSKDLNLNHIVFGIAGSVQLWPRRKEFVKLWWKPDEMRGFVWLEEPVNIDPSEPLPPIRLSDDISRFAYTNPTGHPSGVRIARIVQETFKLGLQSVRWFVLGDDDTIFNDHNLIKVLSKYDPSEMHYIGSSSESHSANTYFSYNMAFGGGGIAISYPLAEALHKMEDDCLERYSQLFGSDDRLHACISELGIPLTKEPGFHQWDVRGNAFGLLAGHPITPFVSMHHLEAIDPVFPHRNSLDGFKLLVKAMKTEPSSFLQRSICYDRKRGLSFSVSMGYVVQVFPKMVLPRELERPERTFKAWNKRDRGEDFDFDTRPSYRSFCNKPFLFFLKDVHSGEGDTVVSTYKRDNATDNWKRRAFCLSWALPVHEVQKIKVVSKPMPERWHLVPRRQCCKVTETKNKILGITVETCDRGRIGSS